MYKQIKNLFKQIVICSNKLAHYLLPICLNNNLFVNTVKKYFFACPLRGSVAHD